MFSSAVLTKAMDRGGRNQCIVQKNIGLAIFPLDAQSLTLAYQTSLAKHLRIRTVLERRLLKFSRALEVQNGLLEQRSQRVKARAVSKRIPQRNLLSLNKFVSEQWTGDSRWINVLLRSDRRHSEGDLLDLDFADVWQHACNDTLYAIRPKQHDESCMQSLENRMQEQISRLDRWKTTQTMLAARKQRHPSINKPRATHNDQLPVRKYSLRSYGAPLPPAEPLIPATNPRKAPATADDSSLGNSKRRTHHRSSKSVSSRAPPADTDLSIHASPIQKPLANTGVRLSSTIQMPPPQDYHHAFSPRPILSQQLSENTPIGRLYSDSKPADKRSKIATDDLYSSYRPSLSLAERTKLSISKRTDVRATPPPVFDDASNETNTTPLDDLAHRTRQSMLNSQPIHQTPKPRSSTTYPIHGVKNQTEPAATEESFFDETIIDLDEIDIFKSRPKVALSPVPSPMVEHVSRLVVPADESYEDDFS